MFLALLEEQSDLGVLIDIPWSKHLCFLQSARACREAREAVSAAARECRRSPAVLAYSIGNEIPPDVVRWHGARRIEQFLRELADAARQADPGRLITYGNYPPTEYLDLSFLDFATFNVYLHDLETFRRYLLRLMNLVGDKPLVLGELGMDTLRHGETAQAEFLAGHVREAMAAGLSGSFVFTWTDEWFTGGQGIADWAFGVTRADRTPKDSCQALAGAFAAGHLDLLPRRPRISVAVCSYNGGQTLQRCLESLILLDYPDYEVILVDDGSTDDTRLIAARFPQVHAIHQENRGLAAARNVALQAATGEIVAYTDSDCMAHPNWLTHLAAQFGRCDAAAVGGPNLAPRPASGRSGRVAACVAAAPGQPMHVLESDQVAEHIPGCNMAFRRAALLAINGFDPQFARRATMSISVGVCKQPVTGFRSRRRPWCGTTAARRPAPTCGSRRATATPRRCSASSTPTASTSAAKASGTACCTARRCKAWSSITPSSTAAPSEPARSSASTSPVRPIGRWPQARWNGTSPSSCCCF